ncbi:unnamed protein product, partial [marine sediment metagenome]
IKPREKKVTVDGFGDVLIKTCPNLVLSARLVSYADPQTGMVLPEEQAKSSSHMLIDQVCQLNGEPMFTDDDFDTLAAADPDALGPLSDAVLAFNAEHQKKTPAKG